MKGVAVAMKMKFEDVLDCVDVAHLNWFILTYLDERKLEGEARSKTAWALFYAWKDKVLKGARSEATSDAK